LHADGLLLKSDCFLMNLFYDPLALEYGAEDHPEGPGRLFETQKLIKELHPDWNWIRPRTADDQEILRVHSAEHLRRLSMEEDFDGDTPAYPAIAEHARRSAGAAVDVVNRALAGEKSFALMRPPGHHAMRDRAMGFCYLNSIAIAAFDALSRGCQRVAIWDFDAHHGNGTESAVRGSKQILFASIHQLPGYPGSGATSFDNILNYPIAPNSDPEAHVREAETALRKLIRFRPDLLLVSAGFDAFAGDPITEMTLQIEHFARFGRRLADLDFPVGAILEGGYSRQLPILVDAFLQEWEKTPASKETK
jgi:acetoin utilization deacetylase AcuC-like enzyme